MAFAGFGLLRGVEAGYEDILFGQAIPDIRHMSATVAAVAEAVSEQRSVADGMVRSGTAIRKSFEKFLDHLECSR